MTERQLIERLHGLCLMADRLRAPGHRHTPESYVADRDEIRDLVRRLYRDLTGNWPGPEVDLGPERRASLPIPTAVLRQRERAKTARAARV